MARWIFVLLAVCATMVPAYACTCFWPQPIKACHLYQIKPVIFRAKVLHVRGSLHRVQVVENFKGLPAGSAELLVSGGGLCDVGLVQGRDYLIFSEVPEPATALASAKKISISGCDPIRVITTETDPDLVYLRTSQKDSPDSPGWIEFRSVQSFEPSMTLDRHTAAPGVRWTAVRQGVPVSIGASAAGTADLNGKYRTDLLTPGLYNVFAESPFPIRLFTAFRRSLKLPVQVPAGGCAIVNGSVESSPRGSQK